VSRLIGADGPGWVDLSRVGSGSDAQDDKGDVVIPLGERPVRLQPLRDVGGGRFGAVRRPDALLEQDGQVVAAEGPRRADGGGGGVKHGGVARGSGAAGGAGSGAPGRPPSSSGGAGGVGGASRAQTSGGGGGRGGAGFGRSPAVVAATVAYATVQSVSGQVRM